MQNGTLLAAIDLGSNSFRLEIGRYHSGHIERIEYLKETVRQGNGLDEEKNLSQAAMERGWECLARFAERLHGFKRQQVRAVATQTLREAKNRDDFVRQAQAILGFPIDVVSGYEEARLIYQGVSRLLPHSDEKRLVVDIGGRSTEMILGQGYSARTMESYRLGSVAWSTRYFPRGQCSAAAFKTAEVAAKAVIDEALDKDKGVESPDGRWRAVVRGGDLILISTADNAKRRLTQDGAASPYATPLINLNDMVAQGTSAPVVRPAIRWSPDSRYLATYRINREEARRLSLVQSTPKDGGPPRVLDYLYPLTGDTETASAQGFIFEVATGRSIPMQTPARPILYYGGP